MEILPTPIREQEGEGQASSHAGRLMPATGSFESICVLLSLYPAHKFDWITRLHMQSVQRLWFNLHSSMFVLVLDFYCQDHYKDMQLLNYTKSGLSLRLLCLVSFFFFSLLFPRVCLLCEFPSNRMSWFIFFLPFAMWMAGFLTF